MGQLIRPGDRATGRGQYDVRWAKLRHLETLVAGVQEGEHTQDRREGGHFLEGILREDTKDCAPF